MYKINEDDRMRIKDAIKSSEWKSQATYAREVLKIHPNSLARKLSNTRSFSQLEVEVMAQTLMLFFEKREV